VSAAKTIVAKNRTQLEIQPLVSPFRVLPWRSTLPFGYVSFLNLNSDASTMMLRILELEYKCVYSSWQDRWTIGSRTAAFPDTRPTPRVKYGRQNSLAIVICTWNHSNRRYRGYCGPLPRFGLRALHGSGKRASTRLVILSPAQRPIPPIHRATSYVFTALISRLSLFVLGLWWIRVEEVSRKRGFVALDSLLAEVRC
jgi:hypothetical protein